MPVQFTRNREATKNLPSVIKRDMTLRRQLFIRYYTAVGEKTFGNGTRSAKAAGCPEHMAHVYACDIMKEQEVASAVQERMDEIFFKIDSNPIRILNEMAAIAHANITDFYDENGNLRSPKELPRSVSAALESVEVTIGKDSMGRPCAVQKIKLHDKKGALESLMKFHTLITERTNPQFQGSSNDSLAQKRRENLMKARAARMCVKAELDKVMEEAAQ